MDYRGGIGIMTTRYSYSAIQDFKLCPLKFFLKHEVGLRLRQESVSQHHLVWGKAMHASLEWLYTNNYANASEIRRIAIAEGAKAIFIEQYPTQLDPEDKAKTQATGLQVLERYVKKWAVEDQRWKVIDVELLDCDLISPDDEEGGYYSRRLDLVVEDLQYGGIYGVDHKTVGGQRTKYLTSSYWDGFDPNSQITQYIDWIKSKYGRCDGFYINAIGINWVDDEKLFDPDDLGKPWEEWSRVEKRYSKYHKYKKDMMYASGLNVQFRREMFNRNSAQIEQERNSTAVWIERIRSASQDYKQTEDAMSSYGFNTSSCHFCEYRGNIAQPGPCMAGWTWPQDQALIELSYHRECRQIIMLECTNCGGRGIELMALDWMFAEIRSKASVGEQFDVVIPPCVQCKGSGKVQGPRCVLDMDHMGECSNEPPVIVPVEDFVIEIPV
jgi:hypothetical protein